ncbi:MAG: GMC family oxidoreductase, partial [Pseudomonadota bacterium]
HVTGTTVMGKDPKDSVVTADGQSHDHPNMFIAGGGVFASSSTAHPTLTIAALALKTSQAVLDYLEVT